MDLHREQLALAAEAREGLERVLQEREGHSQIKSKESDHLRRTVERLQTEVAQQSRRQGEMVERATRAERESAVLRSRLEEALAELDRTKDRADRCARSVDDHAGASDAARRKLDAAEARSRAAQDRAVMLQERADAAEREAEILRRSLEAITGKAAGGGSAGSRGASNANLADLDRDLDLDGTRDDGAAAAKPRRRYEEADLARGLDAPGGVRGDPFATTTDRARTYDDRDARDDGDRRQGAADDRGATLEERLTEGAHIRHEGRQSARRNEDPRLSGYGEDDATGDAANDAANDAASDVGSDAAQGGGDPVANGVRGWRGRQARRRARMAAARDRREPEAPLGPEGKGTADATGAAAQGGADGEVETFGSRLKTAAHRLSMLEQALGKTDKADAA